MLLDKSKREFLQRKRTKARDDVPCVVFRERGEERGEEREREREITQ